MVKRYTYLERNCKEYFFKTSRKLRNLSDTDTWEQMQFKKDRKNFTNLIHSCATKEEICLQIITKLKHWQGNKKDWLDYTAMAINLHKDYFLKDYFYYLLKEIEIYLNNNKFDYLKLGLIYLEWYYMFV